MRKRFSRKFAGRWVTIEAEAFGEGAFTKFYDVKVIEKPVNLSNAGAEQVIRKGLEIGETMVEALAKLTQLKKKLLR